MSAAYIGYMMAFKTDISLRPSRWRDNAPYHFVGPTETQRMMAFSKPIEADPEIVALRRELGSYKA